MPTPTENSLPVEPWLGKTDVRLLAAGKHLRPWEKLGAHPCQMAGVAGTAFAVWAPNARQISVVGDFNQWDARAHPMQHRPEGGAWELFVPGVGDGALYKFSVLGADGATILKTDPCALRTEPGTGGGSGVANGEPLASEALARQGHADSLLLTLPPLGVLWLEPMAVS